jgi:peptide/nickel transport system substrate-binding protein
VLLTGCARPSSDSTIDRPLEVLVPTAVETLDPRDCFDAVSLRASRLVHAGLTRIDPETLDPVPLAAASWTWTTPTTLTVDLREDLTFSSGKPLMADDVAATWRALASPEVNARHRRLTEPLRAVVVEGPHRVRFELARTHATLLSDLEMPILEAAAAHDRRTPWSALAGLGPYALGAATGDRLVFEPRDHGVLPRPAHAVVVQPIRDENARVLRLASGRGDVAFGGISTRLFPALEASGITLTEAPGSGLTYLVPRTDSGPLADRATRRRLSRALDRAGLVRDFFEGHAQATTEIFGAGHWVHRLAPGAAAQNDLTPDTDSSTAPIPLRLLVSADRSRRMLARFLQQELRDEGFVVSVVPLELGTLFARLSSGDFDVALLNVPELLEPNVLRVFLHSASIPPNGSNRGRVRDADLDALLDAAASSADRSQRAPLYAQAEARIAANAYWIPLWRDNVVTLTSPRVHGLTVGGDGRWLGLASVR